RAWVWRAAARSRPSAIASAARHWWRRRSLRKPLQSVPEASGVDAAPAVVAAERQLLQPAPALRPQPPPGCCAACSRAQSPAATSGPPATRGTSSWARRRVRASARRAWSRCLAPCCWALAPEPGWGPEVMWARKRRS
ncbi:hypothetical protein PENTCL1PPCAC_24283, partial [Pristionchus entomophagus]